MVLESAMNFIKENSAIIDGIGNEVLLSCILVSIITALIFICFRKRYRRQEVNEDPIVSHPRRSNNSTCAICLGTLTCAVETNCGHPFCGLCLNQFYEFHHRVMMTCPLCRQQVTMLFVCFTEFERLASRTALGELRRRIIAFVCDYNQAHSHGPRSILQQLLDFPTIFRHLWNDFFSLRGVIRQRLRLRILLCLASVGCYLLITHDLIPESLFGVFGLIDDIVVLIVMFFYLTIVYREAVAARNAQEFDDNVTDA